MFALGLCLLKASEPGGGITAGFPDPACQSKAEKDAL
jgi:hypothetical protein